MTGLSKCAVCGIAASQKCGGCRLVAYCSKDHQKVHWKKGHKSECKCYEIASNEILGRHLRATRDIKKGEIILKETALIAGPKVASMPVCLGCDRLLPPPNSASNYYKCSKCAFPMCGPQCENMEQHRDFECRLMAARKFKAKIDFSRQSHEVGKKESAYCVILPLRCMLLKKKSPGKYEQFANLEDHLQERIETPLYKILRANLVTFIQNIMGMQDWSDADILRVAAILDTNAFDVRQAVGGRKGRAIYPNAAMMSHDCIPNARHTFDDNMNIVFLAKCAISKGDIIATSYTQPLKSTLLRRIHLKQAKCFDCGCSRCADPTEMNTFTGAILCSKCKIGKIISTNAQDSEAVWKCQLCPHQLPAKQIVWGNNSMLKEIEALNKASPRQFEEFIHRYRDTLHEKNTHVLQVKYALTQLYGNVDGFRMSEMNDAAVKRKVELCQELLEIADIFDPGWSIFRGNLLLDLQEATVVQAKREYLNGLLTREATQEKLMEGMQYLKEAVEILKLETDMKDILQERTENLAKELEME